MAKKGNGQVKKKTGTDLGTRLIFETEDEESSDVDEEKEFDEEGMILDKDNVKIIYNALREYKPMEKEEHLYGILLEEFEETLVVEYGELYPDTN